MLLKRCLFPAILCISNVTAQTFKLTPQQIKAAHLDDKTAKNVELAVSRERANWASGPTTSEDIYTIPSNASHLQPGDLIRLEDNTDVRNYTIPAGTSLSRFTYVSETLNGTWVPASAYILWPFSPRRFESISGVPVVAWSHGSDGWNAEVAPSHLRDLQYAYAAPFTLALQGYAVVATDYAGLGVAKNADGEPIIHQWLASPAAANDIAFSIQAARQAYKQLSKQFVVLGHSQGGGAAWSFAQRQIEKPVEGYLGTVAVSPVTSIQRQLNTVPLLTQLIAMAMSHEMKSIFGDFERKYFLTDLGLARLHLLSELSGGDTVTGALYASDLARQGWENMKYYIAAFDKLTSDGDRAFAGPMLVLQGTADESVNHLALSKLVKDTCAKYPNNSLQYTQFKGLDHNPTMFGSQSLWLNWIVDRFSGVQIAKGCRESLIKPLSGRDFKKESPL